MSNTVIGKIVIILLTVFTVAVLMFTDFGEASSQKIYDCSIAEWHPDVPVEVKQECRKLRQEQWQREKEQVQRQPLRT